MQDSELLIGVLSPSDSSDTSDVVDYTKIPVILNTGLELLEEECTMKHTFLGVGRTWEESSGQAGWSDSTCYILPSAAQEQGRGAVMFDYLLNVLSKSLVFELWDPSLHVLLAEFHCFGRVFWGEAKKVDLIGTLTLEFVL